MTDLFHYRLNTMHHYDNEMFGRTSDLTAQSAVAYLAAPVSKVLDGHLERGASGRARPLRPLRETAVMRRRRWLPTSIDRRNRRLGVRATGRAPNR